MKAVEGKRKILKRKQTKSLLIQFQLFTEIFSRTSTIHPRISLGRAIWAGSVSLRMNTVALRDQFKPIRIGENLVVNYNETYDHHILLGTSEMGDWCLASIRCSHAISCFSLSSTLSFHSQT